MNPASLNLASRSTEQDGGVAVFDLHEAIGRCYGDRAMVVEMADFFLTDSVDLLARMETAIQTGDAAELARTAHRMKGTVSYLGAAPATAAALRVEQIGRIGELASAAEAVEELARYAQVLREALIVFLRGEGLVNE